MFQIIFIFFHIAVSRQKRGKILLKWLGMRSKVLSINIYISRRIPYNLFVVRIINVKQLHHYIF